MKIPKLKLGLGKTFLKSISVGVVLILFQIWLLTNVPSWRNEILVYLVFVSLMFSFGAVRTERTLLKVSFIKALPKMLLSFVATLILLYGIGSLVGGEALPLIAVALASVPLYIIFIHGFIVATSEELGFRGWLYENLIGNGMKKSIAMLFVSVVFALFHFFMAGGQWILLLPYVVLGYVFMLAKNKWSIYVAIGIHWAWNVFILAFVQKIGLGISDIVLGLVLGLGI